MKSILAIILTTFGCFFINSTLLAEQMIEKNGYQIHYNIFNSSMLTPKIATQYGIQRVKNQALMNISVLKSNKEATRALVTGEARNPISQLTPLKFHNIKEQEAIYYIAAFKFVDGEVLDFSLSVVPDGESSAIKFSIKQQLFLD